MHVSDKEALKIHGVLGNDSEYTSSSEEGLSDLDEEYYKNQPPPEKIDPSKIVVIHQEDSLILNQEVLSNKNALHKTSSFGNLNQQGDTKNCLPSENVSTLHQVSDTELKKILPVYQNHVSATGQNVAFEILNQIYLHPNGNFNFQNISRPCHGHNVTRNVQQNSLILPFQNGINPADANALQIVHQDYLIQNSYFNTPNNHRYPHEHNSSSSPRNVQTNSTSVLQNPVSELQRLQLLLLNSNAKYQTNPLSGVNNSYTNVDRNNLSQNSYFNNSNGSCCSNGYNASTSNIQATFENVRECHLQNSYFKYASIPIQENNTSTNNAQTNFSSLVQNNASEIPKNSLSFAHSPAIENLSVNGNMLERKTTLENSCHMKTSSNQNLSRSKKRNRKKCNTARSNESAIYFSSSNTNNKMFSENINEPIVPEIRSSTTGSYDNLSKTNEHLRLVVKAVDISKTCDTNNPINQSFKEMISFNYKPKENEGVSSSRQLPKYDQFYNDSEAGSVAAISSRSYTFKDELKIGHVSNQTSKNKSEQDIGKPKEISKSQDLSTSKHFMSTQVHCSNNSCFTYSYENKYKNEYPEREKVLTQTHQVSNSKKLCSNSVEFCGLPHRNSNTFDYYCASANNCLMQNQNMSSNIQPHNTSTRKMEANFNPSFQNGVNAVSVDNSFTDENALGKIKYDQSLILTHQYELAKTISRGTSMISTNSEDNDALITKHDVLFCTSKSKLETNSKNHAEIQRSSGFDNLSDIHSGSLSAEKCTTSKRRNRKKKHATPNPYCNESAENSISKKPDKTSHKIVIENLHHEPVLTEIRDTIEAHKHHHKTEMSRTTNKPVVYVATTFKTYDNNVSTLNDNLSKTRLDHSAPKEEAILNTTPSYDCFELRNVLAEGDKENSSEITRQSFGFHNLNVEKKSPSKDFLDNSSDIDLNNSNQEPLTSKRHRRTELATPNQFSNECVRNTISKNTPQNMFTIKNDKLIIKMSESGTSENHYVKSDMTEQRINNIGQQTPKINMTNVCNLNNYRQEKMDSLQTQNFGTRDIFANTDANNDFSCKNKKSKSNFVKTVWKVLSAVDIDYTFIVYELLNLL